MKVVAFCIISIAALIRRVSCTSPRPMLRPSAVLTNQWIELDTATARHVLAKTRPGIVIGDITGGLPRAHIPAVQ